MNWPNKKYKIIYADPPWSYEDKALAGDRGAGCKYKVMDTEGICGLPVSEISDEDSCLFMWATMPKLNECFSVINSWGFKYKTNAFTWIKKYVDGGFFFGMGRWTRANAELCLLATKGKPKRISAAVCSVIESPLGKHSEKPHEVRKRIIQLIGDLPRIELFARTKTDGWDVWGNEIDGPLPKTEINDLQRELF